MAVNQHLPSVLCCGFGFSAAGSGIGSIVGTALGPRLYPQLPKGQGTPHDQLMAMYGGTLWGIAVGVSIGAVAGVLYAVLVRRSRLKGYASHRISGQADQGASR